MTKAKRNTPARRREARMTNETSAYIIAEMRDEAARADLEQGYSLDDAAEMMREFAWRLEAAIKREKAAMEADALAVGGIVGAAHKRERGDAGTPPATARKGGRATSSMGPGYTGDPSARGAKRETNTATAARSGGPLGRAQVIKQRNTRKDTP